MNLVWAILITTAVTAVAIACILLVRRGAPEGSYFQDGDRAASRVAIVLLGYVMFFGTAIWIATFPVSVAI